MTPLHLVQRWVAAHPRSSLWLSTWAIVILNLAIAEQIGAPRGPYPW
jgi:hypothetical protein